MKVVAGSLCLSLALIALCVGTLWLQNATGMSDCPQFHFPCENGECIDEGLWCDSHSDCFDGSDERYCEKTSLFSEDPNQCPATYFKCENGPCIPMVGRCDDYYHCDDYSDEKNCSSLNSSSQGDSTSTPLQATTHILETSTTTITTSDPTTSSSTHGSSGIFSGFSPDVKANHQIFHLDEWNFDPLEYSYQREKSRNWLLTQRKNNFGWGDETPRALTALYLSDMQRFTKNDESYVLMVKQLELQLALNMMRNETKVLELTDLALYINALMAGCRDPKNFYGDNLVHILRNGVNALHWQGQFVNPSIYLTLCMNNASTYDDARKLQDMHFSRNSVIGRMDIQALAFLTTTCLYRNTKFLTATMYDGIRMQFLHRMNISGIPGNVYEAALLMQALQELKMTLPGLLKSILVSQQEDGSFGGILATYLVLPVLSGQSFLQLNDHCLQPYSTDPPPIEVLQNMKQKKIYVKYSLKNGNSAKITETIQMQVAESIVFSDIMRLAEEINPKYRFEVDVSRKVPVVYSIGGTPNDAEKGLFWKLYVKFNTDVNETRSLRTFSGNIKQLISHEGDEYLFWFQST